MNKHTLRRVLSYIRPRLSLVILSLVLNLLSVALTLLIPILVGRGIDCILGPGQVDLTRLGDLMLKTGLCIAASTLFQWLAGILNNRLTFCTVQDLRNDAFLRLQQLPLRYLDSHPSGDLLSRIITDADTFADGLLMGFTQLFSGVMTILGTLIFMLSLNPLITLTVVVLTPVSLLVARFIARRTYNMFRLQSVTRGEQTSLIDEAVGGQKLVQAFCQEEATLEQFDEINGRLESCSLQATFFSSLVNPGCHIPYQVQLLNGITDELVADAPCFSALLPRFLSFLGDDPLIAHNASFDCSFLYREAARLGIAIPNPVVDTVKLARRVWPGLPSYKLTYLTDYHGIAQEDAHRAWCDARATAKLYLMMHS